MFSQFDKRTPEEKNADRIKSDSRSKFGFITARTSLRIFLLTLAVLFAAFAHAQNECTTIDNNEVILQTTRDASGVVHQTQCENATTGIVSYPYTGAITLSGLLTGGGSGSGGNVALKYFTSDAILYVSTSGNDANDGKSAGSAKLTISAAISALPTCGSWNHCGVVNIGAGTFTINSTIAITSPYIFLIGVNPNQTQIVYAPVSGTAITWTATPYNSDPADRQVGGLFNLLLYSNNNALTVTDMVGFTMWNVVINTLGTGGTVCFDDEGTNAGTGGNEAFTLKLLLRTCAIDVKLNATNANHTFGYGYWNVQHVGASNPCFTLSNNALFNNAIVELVLESCTTAIALTNSQFSQNSGHIDLESATTGITLTNSQFQDNTLGLGASTTTSWSCDATSIIQRNTGSILFYSGTASITAGCLFQNGLFTPSLCTSSASPAVCGSSPAGFFVIAAGATTVTVNTSSVTANSQIFIQPDDSLGSKLGVTCNTTAALLAAEPWVSTRTAATSFAVNISAAPTTNPECFSYNIIN